jgi:hypothetical protein
VRSRRRIVLACSRTFYKGLRPRIPLEDNYRKKNVDLQAQAKNEATAVPVEHLKKARQVHSSVNTKLTLFQYSRSCAL